MAARKVRYDVLLIVVTAFCGAVITYLFQERAARHREESEQREARRTAATQLFRDVGQLMDRRLFHWSRAYGAFLARLPDSLDQVKTYRAAVADWNLSVLTNAALICRYFGIQAGQDFTQKVMPGFTRLDYLLQDTRKRGKGKDPPPDDPFHTQRRAIFGFNLQLIDLIRSGAVVEGKSPGQCSGLPLGPGDSGTTVTPRPPG